MTRPEAFVKSYAPATRRRRPLPASARRPFTADVILREHLEDHPENYTRFLLLAPSADIAENADKLSLVLHLAHKPGSLCSALNAFARRNLNLLKIESRPIPGTPWSYCFYLDLQASLKDPRTRAALDELKELCGLGKNSWVLSASQGLNYLPRMAFSSAGFSLWILVHARTQARGLKSPSGDPWSRLCSARLQASIGFDPKRPPEGGRYKKAPQPSANTGEKKKSQ